MPRSEVVAAAYRLHAAMCTEIAERTSDLKNRLVLLKMAAAWLTLAEQAEKNSQVHKTLEPLQQRQQRNRRFQNVGLVANFRFGLLADKECVQLKLGGLIWQC